MSDVIIITGAGQRLGLHCALTLKQAGFQVLATYRSEKAGVQQMRDAGINCYQLDVCDTEQLSEFISHIKQHYQKLRAVIHNASDWRADAITDVSNNVSNDAAIYDAMQAVHAKAPYIINRALAPLLANSSVADIIHITDFVASVGSSKHMAYAASKSALTNLTFSFARALAPKVKVNAIAPALLMFNQDDSDAYKTKALNKSLLQLEPGANEMANCVTYLLNSRYITGKVLELDGGRPLNLP
ncbi:dihydromonapterin reductase [Rheinheimera baltica]|uniref:Dihydromonapterin reductase n=1 Tax=Rheinheimera baltica TaxID=67576 RepID=A0ABT9HU00_9GAMM|nr:dihydromonapterin reductase [Rheinheimera baltica]MDP5134605.1 dihydromonapterin reductase [Rheinheimera baltica]